MPRREYEHEDEGFGEASRYTAHLDRGWSLLNRGDYQRARNSAHQALKLRPQVPDAAMLMAAISLAEADPESSLEWYERAIEADADFVDAQLAAAQVLLYDLEQPHRALVRASQARDLDEATLADQLDFGLLEIEALVSLDDRGSAAEKLEQLAELWVIEQLLNNEVREELADSLREFAGNARDLDPEDIEQLMVRVVQLALRVARLQMELGTPGNALPWLDGLLRRFGDDPDIWYMYNEAAYLAGEPTRAAHAALQVLQLDGRTPIPDWAPPAEQLHAKIVDLLLNSAATELRALAREPGFVVVVNEAPPFEFVLEGVDPRARSLALAARNVQDTEAPPALTGLALYRRNLVHFARELSQLEHELTVAVFDELSVFYGFDDVQRERLGLPPSELGWLGQGVGVGSRGMLTKLPDNGENDMRAKKAAKRTLSKKISKKASAKKKSASKKPTSKKRPATKKAAAGKKTAATKKTAAAKKTTTAKKAAAAKTQARKRPSAKKPAAKKPTASSKKASVKPTAKPSAKKRLAKKSVGKKAAAKKKKASAKRKPAKE